MVFEICVTPAVAGFPSFASYSNFQTSGSNSSAHSQYRLSCSNPRPETISPRNTRRSGESSGGGTNAPGPWRRRRASCSARIAAVGAISFCRFSRLVSSLFEALRTEYSHTEPSLRSMRYTSSGLSPLKSGDSARDPSGNASIVINTSWPSGWPLWCVFCRATITGWSEGSSSGPDCKKKSVSLVWANRHLD